MVISEKSVILCHLRKLWKKIKEAQLELKGKSVTHVLSHVVNYVVSYIEPLPYGVDCWVTWSKNLL